MTEILLTGTLNLISIKTNQTHQTYTHTQNLYFHNINSLKRNLLCDEFQKYKKKDCSIQG